MGTKEYYISGMIKMVNNTAIDVDYCWKSWTLSDEYGPGLRESTNLCFMAYEVGYIWGLKFLCLYRLKFTYNCISCTALEKNVLN